MILTIALAFLAWIVLAVIAGLIWGRAIRASHEVRWSDQDDSMRARYDLLRRR